MINRQQAKTIFQSLLIAKVAIDKDLAEGFNTAASEMHMIEESLKHISNHASNNCWGGFEIVDKKEAKPSN
jgi:hypothetical protein